MMTAFEAIVEFDARLGGGHGGSALYVLALAAGGYLLATAGSRFLWGLRETHEARDAFSRR